MVSGVVGICVFGWLANMIMMMGIVIIIIIIITFYFIFLFSLSDELDDLPHEHKGWLFATFIYLEYNHLLSLIVAWSLSYPSRMYIEPLIHAFTNLPVLLPRRLVSSSMSGLVVQWWFVGIEIVARWLSGGYPCYILSY